MLAVYERRQLSIGFLKEMNIGKGLCFRKEHDIQMEYHPIS